MLYNIEISFCSDLMKIIKDQPPVHTWCISTRFLPLNVYVSYHSNPEEGVSQILNFEMMRAGGCYMVIIIVMPLSIML